MPESKNVGLRLAAGLTARIDAWARARGLDRVEAIERLIELGLKAKPAASVTRVTPPGALAIEALAASELERLIDPATPKEERERRIHRLTDGPPEFVDLRIDLPRR